MNSEIKNAAQSPTQRLSVHFFKLIMLCSLVVMCISALINVWFGYQDEKQLIERDINFVHDSYIPAVASSLFNVDKEQQKLLLEGMARLRGIRYCEIDDRESPQGQHLSSGIPSGNTRHMRTFPLTYSLPMNQTMTMGNLIVQPDEEGLVKRLRESISNFILSTIIMIAITSIIAMILFQMIVARHLEKLVQSTKQINLTNLGLKLQLDRKPRRDELQTMLEAIEDLQCRLADGMVQRDKAEKERLLAVEQQQKLVEQLQQSQKMRAIGQLAGGIAHDFNNILSAVVGYTDMAIDNVRNDTETVGFLQNVLTASNRAKHLVSQILTFSRRGPEQKALIYLKPIVNEVIDLLRASTPSTITLHGNIAKDTMPVMADPTKVHEAVMNLATNAVHAMDEKGELTIALFEKTVTEKNEGVLGTVYPGFYSIVEVRDTGAGMNNEMIQHIFEPFFTTKPEHQGTGLGLSVVFGIMQSHSGNIQVESTPGKGSLFRLLFPKSKGDVISESNQHQTLKRGHENILFVDDEQQLAELGMAILSSLGYKVTITTRSPEALKLLEADPQAYDLLITDQTMPNLTGIELAQRALELRPDLPIILCTGFSTKVNEQTARESGCRAFAQKPLSKTVLAETIRNVLDNPKPAGSP